MADASPDCLKCLHFFVTWEPDVPRGCRVFGIKTRNLPSWDVRVATGHSCPAFELKPGVDSGAQDRYGSDGGTYA